MLLLLLLLLLLGLRLLLVAGEGLWWGKVARLQG